MPSGCSSFLGDKENRGSVGSRDLERSCLVAQSCLTLSSPKDDSPPISSVHGILQARILEWVATSFSRGSSWPRDQTRSPALPADSLPLSHQGSSSRKEYSSWKSYVKHPVLLLQTTSLQSASPCLPPKPLGRTGTELFHGWTHSLPLHTPHLPQTTPAATCLLLKGYTSR